MTSDRWLTVQALFHAALERDRRERSDFLKTRCGDEPGMLSEVEALLAADRQADDYLMDLAESIRGAVVGLAADDPPSAPSRIGPYRVVRQLSQGGMGVVYLGERDDGRFERRVAIKLLRNSPEVEELHRRFRSEQRILASLAHPSIAQLLDAGVTHDGLPFLVMEYVEGLPITEHCDRHRLDVRARLRLFVVVCAAVQHAHRNLIIHRDLKPSNIFVTKDGQVKLLDFGIAKLIDEAASAADTTRTGYHVLTPNYASPEQVRGEPLTTASDVYALGVVLYELLAGKPPYRLAHGSVREIAEIVCQRDVPPPSAHVRERDVGGAGATEPDAAPIPATRSTSVDRLRRQLRGDLDAIAMLALAKDPQRRYGSAEQLAEDIRRHVAGLPVQARRGGRTYAVRKFVRRHRWQLAATTAFLALLAAFGTIYTVEVTKERNRAELEAGKSARVTAFLMNLFEAGDPRTALGDTSTVYDLLERGVARAEALADDRSVQAQMLDVVGRVYESMGEYERAQPLLERGLALRREELGPDHPDVAESVDNLASLARNKGDYAAAEPLIREALAVRRAMLGNVHVDVASSLNSLASLLQANGEYDEAETLFREALAMRQQLLGETDFDRVTSMNNLAGLLHSKGDYEEAETLYREVVAIDRATLDEAHPDMAIDVGNLAVLLTDIGSYDEAETLFHEMLAMHRKTLGNEHPSFATGLNGLATLLRKQGRYQEAEQYMRQALAIDRAKRGETHPYTITDQANLAVLRHLQGDHAAADTLLRQALEAFREQLGARHPRIARALTSLADVLAATGDYDGAEQRYREALAMQRELLQPEHLDIAATLRGLAALYVARGDYEAAEPLFQEALALQQLRLPDNHPYLAQLQSDVGACLVGLGRYAEAEPLLLESHAALRSYDDQERSRQKALERLVALYEAWGKPEQAGQYR